MRCTKCGTHNAADSRFCNQCATPLNRACPKCAHLNAPDAKFCAQCAVALGGQAAVGADASASPVSRGGVRIAPEQPDPSRALEGARKTVTALFADIKGSMELMEELDPEEARAIIDPALQIMIEAIGRYAGSLCSPPAMAFSRCLARRWPVKTIRSGPCTRRSGCRKS